MNVKENTSEMIINQNEKNFQIRNDENCELFKILGTTTCNSNQIACLSLKNKTFNIIDNKEELTDKEKNKSNNYENSLILLHGSLISLTIYKEKDEFIEYFQNPSYKSISCLDVIALQYENEIICLGETLNFYECKNNSNLNLIFLQLISENTNEENNVNVNKSRLNFISSINLNFDKFKFTSIKIVRFILSKFLILIVGVTSINSECLCILKTNEKFSILDLVYSYEIKDHKIFSVDFNNKYIIFSGIGYISVIHYDAKNLNSCNLEIEILNISNVEKLINNNENEENEYISVLTFEKNNKYKAFSLTSKGILFEILLSNEGHKCTRWLELKATKGITMARHNDLLICGLSDGIIRIFNFETINHLITFQRPPSIGKCNIDIRSTKKKQNNTLNDKKISLPDYFADVIALKCMMNNENENNLKLVSLYSDKTFFIWEFDVNNTQSTQLFKCDTFINSGINSIDSIIDYNEGLLKIFIGCEDMTTHYMNFKLDNFIIGNKKLENLYFDSDLDSLYKDSINSSNCLGFTLNELNGLKLWKNKQISKQKQKKIQIPRISYSKYIRRIFFSFIDLYDINKRFNFNSNLDVLKIINKFKFSEENEKTFQDSNNFLEEVWEIKCVKISPCFNLLSVGDSQGYLYIYSLNDLHSFSIIKICKAHNSTLSSIDYNQDSSILFTGSFDGFVHIFDLIKIKNDWEKDIASKINNIDLKDSDSNLSYEKPLTSEFTIKISNLLFDEDGKNYKPHADDNKILNVKCLNGNMFNNIDISNDYNDNIQSRFKLSEFTNPNNTYLIITTSDNSIVIFLKKEKFVFEIVKKVRSFSDNLSLNNIESDNQLITFNSCISSQNLLYQAQNKKITIFNLNNFNWTKEFEIRRKNFCLEIYLIAFNSGSQIMALFCSDQQIKICSSVNGEIYSKIPTTHEISALKFVLNYLFACTLKGYILIFRINIHPENLPNMLNKSNMSTIDKVKESKDKVAFLSNLIKNNWKGSKFSINSEINISGNNEHNSSQISLDKCQNIPNQTIEFENEFFKTNKETVLIDAISLSGSKEKNINQLIDDYQLPYLSKSKKLITEEIKINNKRNSLTNDYIKEVNLNREIKPFMDDNKNKNDSINLPINNCVSSNNQEINTFYIDLTKEESLNGSHNYIIKDENVKNNQEQLKIDNNQINNKILNNNLIFKENLIENTENNYDNTITKNRKVEINEIKNIISKVKLQIDSLNNSENSSNNLRSRYSHSSEKKLEKVIKKAENIKQIKNQDYTVDEYDILNDSSLIKNSKKWENSLNISAIKEDISELHGTVNIKSELNNKDNEFSVKLNQLKNKLNSININSINCNNSKYITRLIDSLIANLNLYEKDNNCSNIDPLFSNERTNSFEIKSTIENNINTNNKKLVQNETIDHIIEMLKNLKEK